MKASHYLFVLCTLAALSKATPIKNPVNTFLCTNSLINKQFKQLNLMPSYLEANFILSLTHKKMIDQLNNAQAILISHTTKNTTLAQNLPTLVKLCENLITQHHIIAQITRNSISGIQPSEEDLFEKSNAVLGRITSLMPLLIPNKLTIGNFEQ